MPSTMLPTPAPSTEIEGKRASFSQGQIDIAFTLGPAAIAGINTSAPITENSPSSSSTTSNGSDSSYRPVSPQRSSYSAPGRSSANPAAAAAASALSRPSAGTRRRSSAANPKQPLSNQTLIDAPNNDQSLGQLQTQSYILPPPPTRSRKIIQMKPRTQDEMAESASTIVPTPLSKVSTTSSTSSSGASTHSDGKVAATGTAAATEASPSAANTGTKRKQQAGPTTAAGRKIARKTAHSLIERRRRSKMNEEFAVLKDMIPACEGQDMHKLQVLSASIEYMRYLEQCLADLKSVHARCPPLPSPHLGALQQQHAASHPYASPTAHMLSPVNQRFQMEMPARQTTNQSSITNEDSEMSDAGTTSPQSSLPPSIAPRPMHYPQHAPSVSPAIMPSAHASPALHASQQRGSYSSLYNFTSAAYPGSAYSSAHPSPAFVGQMTPTTITTNAPSYGGAFRLSSPALPDAPVPRGFASINSQAMSPATAQEMRSGSIDTEDNEATAALLMLNTDRRSWSGANAQNNDAGGGKAPGAKSGRGMSVRDLLSN